MKIKSQWVWAVNDWGPLRFHQGGDSVTVQAPAYANLAPPGINAVPHRYRRSPLRRGVRQTLEPHTHGESRNG